MQILRYDEGGYNKAHIDFIPADQLRNQGVRALTFFIYLSDGEPKSGGETYFQYMDLKVRPKKGKALLFPNVLPEDPDVEDKRTMHSAFGVKSCVKHAANVWIHQRDFKAPFYERCNFFFVCFFFLELQLNTLP
jgi:prolyl 4-hydroxylase